MKLTKKQVNEQLKNVWDIYAGNIPGRYTGLSINDCETDIQILFRTVVSDENFSYKTKKEQYNEVYKRLGLPVGEHKQFTKKMGGVIIRNLPANDKYIFVDSGQFAEDSGWCCENCGRFIKNWNEVKNTNGKSFLIGSECINTVVKFDITADWTYRQNQSEINKIKRIKRDAIKNNWTIKSEKDLICFYDGDRYKGYVKIEAWERVNKKGIKKHS